MDPKLFRLPTLPNYYVQSELAPVKARDVAIAQTQPAPNNRFQGYPASMEDARLITDYEPRCANNIPAGQQFPTKRFMQHSGEELITMSRRLSAKRMGADFMFDRTVVPPLAEIVSCSRSACRRNQKGESESGANPYGGAPIGTGRHEAVPELFGTYTIPYTTPFPPKIQYTTQYQGGRNSLRGATPLNVYPPPLVKAGLHPVV
jgi:hypothetical protein|uniref:Uncharacterized protein n=1 Tax=viral metagenome TaxID=1070528 RepID=A0A6C0K7H3_9ZZZZ